MIKTILLSVSSLFQHGQQQQQQQQQVHRNSQEKEEKEEKEKEAERDEEKNEAEEKEDGMKWVTLLILSVTNDYTYIYLSATKKRKVQMWVPSFHNFGIGPNGLQCVNYTVFGRVIWFSAHDRVDLWIQSLCNPKASWSPIRYSTYNTTKQLFLMLFLFLIPTICQMAHVKW